MTETGRYDKMHDLKVGRFYESRQSNGKWVTPVGPIKSFTLRGIKDSPHVYACRAVVTDWSVFSGRYYSRLIWVGDVVISGISGFAAAFYLKEPKKNFLSEMPRWWVFYTAFFWVSRIWP